MIAGGWNVCLGAGAERSPWSTSSAPIPFSRPASMAIHHYRHLNPFPKHPNSWVRIGEALAVRNGTDAEGEPLLDLDHAEVQINATIVRVKAEGLIIQAWPNTDAGWRRLALPPCVVTMIDRRSREVRFTPPQGAIFGSPLGHLRDPSNTAGDLREVLDGIGCQRCDGRGWIPPPKGQHKRVRCDAGPFSWVTSHVFRKTVATRLDDAGLSARQIADQLGHARPGRVHGPEGRHRRRGTTP